MNTQLAVKNLSQNSDELFLVLKASVYPNATSDASIHMVMSYCKIRKLDPIKKPVHLVPMNVKSGRKDSSGKDIYEWRDVVMPGIGLYRIEADRSGCYAGQSEPEFGEEITQTIGNSKVTFPKWCKVTVQKQMPNGSIVEFTAKEFWLENYATKGRNDPTPNDVWKKRAYGQLAKCTEAQALRKAFPDAVGQDNTNDEMEGKFFPDPKTEIIKLNSNDNEKLEQIKYLEPDNLDNDFNDMLTAINKCDTIEQLKAIFDEFKKIDFTSKPDYLRKLIDAKDQKKNEFMVAEFNSEIDSTVEVI